MKPLSSDLYDKLKFQAQVLLPGLGTLYVALAAIWGLPNAEGVSGTILAVDTFLGGLLALSSASYGRSDEKFDGAIHVLDATDTGRNFGVHIPLSAEELESKQEMLFRVHHKS